MEAMQYYPRPRPGQGELKEDVGRNGKGLTEAVMGSKDVTLHNTTTVNGNDSMKVQKACAELKGSGVEEEEEEEEEDKVSSGEGHKSSVYLDEDGGMWRCRGCVWAYKLGNPCMDDEGKPFHFGNGAASYAEIGNVGELGRLVSAARGGVGAVEEEEEQVIELEFLERGAMHTHNAYCPNCRSPISKVILRIKRSSSSETTRPPIPHNNFDLLGCLACFRIFLPNKTTTTTTTTDDETSTGRRLWTEDQEQQESHNSASDEGAKCFDLLWFFGGTPKAQQTSPSATIASHQGQKPNDRGHLRGDSSAAITINSSSSHGHDSDGTQSGPTQQGTRAPPPPPEMIDDDDDDTIQQDEPQYSVMPSGSSDQEGGGLISGGDVRIPIDESPNKAGTQDPPEEERGGGGGGSNTSVEVVKSVVYGGLMESITSLSVVSSAAASGATTLHTITIGVANLIGGFFVVAHNLLDLKTNRPEDEYQKVLGQRNHFLLHAILAMLSYIIFGLAPPALYGFTFRLQSDDDPDLKLLGVAMVSFPCILLLAIGKAYTSGANTFKQYFLTILQYAIAAATASGVAYAVAHLFHKLMDELGWFNSTPTPALLLPNINSPNPNSAFY